MSERRPVTQTLGKVKNTGFEILTPGNTATPITLALKKSNGKFASGALISVTDETLKCAFHGPSATATAGTNIGHPVQAGQTLELSDAEEVKNFNCIDETSGSNGNALITLFYNQ